MPAHSTVSVFRHAAASAQTSEARMKMTHRSPAKTSRWNCGTVNPTIIHGTPAIARFSQKMGIVNLSATSNRSKGLGFTAIAIS